MPNDKDLEVNNELTDSVDSGSIDMKTNEVKQDVSEQRDEPQIINSLPKEVSTSRTSQKTNNNNNNTSRNEGAFIDLEHLHKFFNDEGSQAKERYITSDDGANLKNTEFPDDRTIYKSDSILGPEHKSSAGYSIKVSNFLIMNRHVGRISEGEIVINDLYDRELPADGALGAPAGENLIMDSIALPRRVVSRLKPILPIPDYLQRILASMLVETLKLRVGLFLGPEGDFQNLSVSIDTVLAAIARTFTLDKYQAGAYSLNYAEGLKKLTGDYMTSGKSLLESASIAVTELLGAHTPYAGSAGEALRLRLIKGIIRFYSDDVENDYSVATLITKFTNEQKDSHEIIDALTRALNDDNSVTLQQFMSTLGTVSDAFASIQQARAASSQLISLYQYLQILGPGHDLYQTFNDLTMSIFDCELGKFFGGLNYYEPNNQTSLVMRPVNLEDPSGWLITPMADTLSVDNRLFSLEEMVHLSLSGVKVNDTHPLTYGINGPSGWAKNVTPILDLFSSCLTVSLISSGKVPPSLTNVVSTLANMITLKHPQVPSNIALVVMPSFIKDAVANAVGNKVAAYGIRQAATCITFEWREKVIDQIEKALTGLQMGYDSNSTDQEFMFSFLEADASAYQVYTGSDLANLGNTQDHSLVEVLPGMVVPDVRANIFSGDNGARFFNVQSLRSFPKASFYRRMVDTILTNQKLFEAQFNWQNLTQAVVATIYSVQTYFTVLQGKGSLGFFYSISNIEALKKLRIYEKFENGAIKDAFLSQTKGSDIQPQIVVSLTEPASEAIRNYSSTNTLLGGLLTHDVGPTFTNVDVGESSVTSHTRSVRFNEGIIQFDRLLNHGGADLMDDQINVNILNSGLNTVATKNLKKSGHKKSSTGIDLVAAVNAEKYDSKRLKIESIFDVSILFPIYNPVELSRQKDFAYYRQLRADEYRDTVFPHQQARLVRNTLTIKKGENTFTNLITANQELFARIINSPASELDVVIPGVAIDSTKRVVINSGADITITTREPYVPASVMEIIPTAGEVGLAHGLYAIQFRKPAPLGFNKKV